MAVSTLMLQVKVTCKKETFDIIESIDKKQRNRLSKLVDRYIFTVEILFEENVSDDNIEQWEIDHPNTISKNVVKNIKNCVKHNYNCYLCITNPNFPGKTLLACSNKFMGDDEYEIGDQRVKLHVDSNNKVTFNIG